MDWKWQLIISIGVPLITSILTYLAAVKKSNDDIKSVKINAETEIKKIKEESNKEIKNIEIEYEKQIEKIKVETDEKIKLKIAESELNNKDNNEKMKNDMAKNFLDEYIKNPEKGNDTFNALLGFASRFQDKK